MEKKTYVKTNVQAVQDWDNDGWLRITGAETLKKYSEIQEGKNKIPVNEYGVFFAFSNKQFDEGYKGLVKRGLIKDGDRVKNFGSGAFGTSEGMKRWMKEVDELDDQIRRECDPYEIYLYEYNNYECCIDLDGDQRAVEHVIRLFGVEIAKQALEGRRFRPCGNIEGIKNDMDRYNKN